jgi:hypothetical protein
MQNKIKIWKPVVGYENSYKVSDAGDVIGLDRFVQNGNRIIHRKGKVMNKTIHHKGYEKVSLSMVENGKTKQRAFFVHRLVATAFILNPENKEQVNHKDGDKLNNCLENLEWVTNFENMEHAKRNHLNLKAKGESHGMSKLTTIIVSDIKNRLAKNELNKDIAKIYGVDPTTVSDIKRGKIWKHVAI